MTSPNAKERARRWRPPSLWRSRPISESRASSPPPAMTCASRCRPSACCAGYWGKRIKDQSGSRLVAKLEETLSAMSGMLNTLLDINQLEAGIVRPDIVEFQIGTMLDRLRTEFAYHATAKQLGWRVVASGLNVRSDPRLLEQTLRNLLANAVKYTERGKILLGCRRRGDKLRIEVWDTGIGIPAGQLKAIFEEFHQLDNPARERNRGLGLGLSIVQRISDLLGHAIEALALAARGALLPDVIIADYNLPGDLTGAEVIARLRESLHREIPAIILTGDISSDTLRKIAHAGCVHLSKPAEPETLTQQIQGFLAV